MPALRSARPTSSRAFSLIELLCATVVFLVLGLIISQLLSSATALTAMSNKKQEADAQGRMIFSRLALDFSRMLKRDDVKYFLGKQDGNDRMAFLAEVSGYYPSTGSPSTLSVVSYRMGEGNGDYRGLQRASKALGWAPDGSGESPVAFHQEIAALSPDAVGNAESDIYEEIGPGVIRFEYFHLLKDGTLSDRPGSSSTPTEANGLRDVAAICVVMAVMDPSVIGRVTPAEVRALAAKLRDFSPASMSTLGALERDWQQTVDADDFVRRSGGAVRILSRCFPLDS
jgi:prepilin-type N-terminal cleavage/methylation domain